MCFVYQGQSGKTAYIWRNVTVLEEDVKTKRMKSETQNKEKWPSLHVKDKNQQK